MRNINISSSLKEFEIGRIDDPFHRCDLLESINVEGNNPYMTSVDGVLMTKDMKKIIRCPQAKTSFTVPDGVTTVGYDAFEDCHINKLIFPESATKFENGSINLRHSDNCEIFFKGHLESFGYIEHIPNNSKLYVVSDEDRNLILSENEDAFSGNITVELMP